MSDDIEKINKIFNPKPKEEKTAFPININKANKSQLMELPGIGDVLAQRIIDYRNANGPFQSIAEITNVSGIGVKRFDAIKDDITV